MLTSAFFVQLTTVFLAYLVAGKLGQATTSIRSSNLGPVWPAYGIALASLLAYGIQVWPAIAASAFVVALSSVTPVAALGQAAGATLAATTGAVLLRRIRKFDPFLSRLRDALGTHFHRGVRQRPGQLLHRDFVALRDGHSALYPVWDRPG